MKTNSKKIHLYIIITAAILALAAAIGTVCHFLSNGFFQYGFDYGSYKSVSVTFYESKAQNDAKVVRDTCKNTFEKYALTGYTEKTDISNGFVEYVFADNADSDALQKAVDEINTAIAYGDEINVAYNNDINGLTTNADIYIWCSIALASAMAFQALYLAIRYKLTMALTNLITNVQSVLLFAAILAITRIPVGSYVAVAGTLCVLFTMLCSQFFFNRMRAYLKMDAGKKLNALEQADEVAKTTLRPIGYVCAALAIIGALFAIVIGFTAWSFDYAAIALAVIVAAIVACYGSALFAPAVYGQLKNAFDNAKLAKNNAKWKN